MELLVALRYARGTHSNPFARSDYNTVRPHGVNMTNTTILTTDSGIRFGILGQLPRQPAPTIFVFALSIEETLGSDYSLVGQLLARDGYLCVCLDVPGHGADADPAEPNALCCWRQRI